MMNLCGGIAWVVEMVMVSMVEWREREGGRAAMVG